jgi:diamine N-acetyltransferase
MSVEIRPATRADLEDLISLNGLVQDIHARIRPDLFRSDWSRAELREFWRARLTSSPGEIAIAVLGDRTVGYIWFRIEDRPRTPFKKPHRRLDVDQICVDDAGRRKGVGSRLLEHAEAEAERMGIGEIVIHSWAANLPAQSFFRSNNYHPMNVILAKGSIARGFEG